MRQPLLVTVLVAALALAPWLSPARAGHEKPVPFSTAEWKTNFARHSVPLEEIISGGPPKDGIPAIDAPKFDTVAAGDRWLKAREPVVLFQRGREARAYPLQILIWHEIVNDTVAGQPVAITFCPLCNTAIAFDRRLGDRVLDFGTTGKLRFSDLVLDTGTHTVRRGQREIALTSLEFKLLQEFLLHPRQVLSKEVLLDRVWGYDFGGNTNIVEVYVKQLRQKLEAQGEPRLLHTIRGAGYVLREE